MTDVSGSAPSSPAPEASSPARNAERLLARLELPDAATGRLGDLHPRVLARMRERVDVIANFLRARISFFVTARREDVDAFDAELELAGANLVASRSLAVVIDRLISGALPDEAEFDRLGDAALGIYSAVEAL